MTESIVVNEAKTGRPLSITIMCIIGAIAVALNFYLSFSSYAQYIGWWYQLGIACFGVFGLASIIGLWKMKRWAGLAFIGYGSGFCYMPIFLSHAWICLPANWLVLYVLFHFISKHRLNLS
jgi:hypothetical protein